MFMWRFYSLCVGGWREVWFYRGSHSFPTIKTEAKIAVKKKTSF